MLFSPIVKKFGGYYALYSKFHTTNSKFLKWFYTFINKGYQHETNSYLPFETQIAGPINFVHGVYGIFVSGGAVIGKNCNIFHQVTIGSNMLIDSKGFGSPTIGDNCLIGAGAKVIGNVKIGNNCRVGANAVVACDMPDNTVCVQGKPIFIEKNQLNNKVYQITPNGWAYFQNGKLILEKDKVLMLKLNQKSAFENQMRD